jgi:hypothetical protein
LTLSSSSSTATTALKHVNNDFLWFFPLFIFVDSIIIIIIIYMYDFLLIWRRRRIKTNERVLEHEIFYKIKKNLMLDTSNDECVFFVWGREGGVWDFVVRLCRCLGYCFC